MQIHYIHCGNLHLDMDYFYIFVALVVVIIISALVYAGKSKTAVVYGGRAPTLTDIIPGLPDTAFSAFSNNQLALYGNEKKWKENSGYVWTSMAGQPGDYLQIDFGKTFTVKSIVIHPQILNGNPTNYTTSFYLRYSTNPFQTGPDNDKWTLYPQLFQCSPSRTDEILFSFNARAIRIMPLTFVGLMTLSVGMTGYPEKEIYNDNYYILNDKFVKVGPTDLPIPVILNPPGIVTAMSKMPSDACGFFLDESETMMTPLKDVTKIGSGSHTLFINKTCYNNYLGYKLKEEVYKYVYSDYFTLGKVIDGKQQYLFVDIDGNTAWSPTRFGIFEMPSKKDFMLKLKGDIWHVPFQDGYPTAKVAKITSSTKPLNPSVNFNLYEPFVMGTLDAVIEGVIVGINNEIDKKYKHDLEHHKSSKFGGTNHDDTNQRDNSQQNLNFKKYRKLKSSDIKPEDLARLRANVRSKIYGGSLIQKTPQINKMLIPVGTGLVFMPDFINTTGASVKDIVSTRAGILALTRSGIQTVKSGVSPIPDIPMTTEEFILQNEVTQKSIVLNLYNPITTTLPGLIGWMEIMYNGIDRGFFADDAMVAVSVTGTSNPVNITSQTPNMTVSTPQTVSISTSESGEFLKKLNPFNIAPMKLSIDPVKSISSPVLSNVIKKPPPPCGWWPCYDITNVLLDIIMGIVNLVLPAIQGAVDIGVSIINVAVIPLINIVLAGINKIPDIINTIVLAPINAIPDIINTVIITPLNTLIGPIVKLVNDVVSKIDTIVKGTINLPSTKFSVTVPVVYDVNYLEYLSFKTVDSGIDININGIVYRLITLKYA